jgi:flagellar biosynthesis protein FlhG
VLVNMVRSAREGRRVFDRVDAVCRRFLSLTPRYAGYVLSDPRVAAAVRRRTPFMLAYPQSDASTCMNQLAHRLERHVTEPSSDGLLRRMVAWFGR